MLILRGPQAYSHFRLERFLKQINYIAPQICYIYSEFIHLVDLKEPLTKEEHDRLWQLLQYGEWNIEPISLENSHNIYILPRKEHSSLWSNKATDIALLCGLKKINRIERGMVFAFESLDGLSKQSIESIASFLHDPITEEVVYELQSVNSFFLRDPEIFLKDRIKTKKENGIFHVQWIIDNIMKTQSLFSMIENTSRENPRGLLSTNESSAAIIESGKGALFFANPNQDQYPYQYQYHHENLPMVVKVVSGDDGSKQTPYTMGAITVGKEIRDIASVGRGAFPKVGLCGFSVSNLNIPGFQQVWEIENVKSTLIKSTLNSNTEKNSSAENSSAENISALEILLEASLGIAQYNNNFGRPNIGGYFRTFEFNVDSEIWGYHKPIILSGGLGSIRYSQIQSRPLKPQQSIIILGSQNAVLHTVTDPEMQRRCQEVINRCISFGIDNPIVAIQDFTAGELTIALSKILQNNKLGAYCEVSEELYSKAEERFLLVVDRERLEHFKQIAIRENCPFLTIGHINASAEIKLVDRSTQEIILDLPLTLLLGKTNQHRRETFNQDKIFKPLAVEIEDLTDTVFRLLRHPCIADKSFLITIQDRGVGGLVSRDPLVGPWQTAVSDCAVTARSFESYQGEAFSIGERAPLALISAGASARMAVGEAITNIAAANIGVLSDIRLSANWMAACGVGIEDAHLFEAVEALGLSFCPELGITIAVGKDSLNMQAENVTSPVSVVITAFAPVMDIRKTLTPVLNQKYDTALIFINLSPNYQRLGGSVFATVYNQLGDTVPDVEDLTVLKSFFATIQKLNMEEKILAYHDRSDGGLFITLCEMAFASRTGLQFDISDLGDDPKSILFNEELGAVIQVKLTEVETILTELREGGLNDCTLIATIRKKEEEFKENAKGTAKETLDEINIIFKETLLFSQERILLQKAWSETSFQLQKLRDNPRLAKKQYDSIDDAHDPGLNVDLSFDINEDVTLNLTKFSLNKGAKPKVAILREQGTQGYLETAAAFERAGFECFDVHTNDLHTGQFSLTQFKGLAICGGFSFGDILGAGVGWARRILLNTALKDQFENFFNRKDTFTLGLGNGCQMLTHLKSLIPGAELWPIFVQNYSEQFEGRLCLVEVQHSPSLFLKGMEDSRLLVPVANASGRAEFESDSQIDEILKAGLVTLRYVDNYGRKTTIYPANPSGSPLGITGLTTVDGRVTIMMPSPERAFRTVQHSWHPDTWGEDGPWLRIFRNARVWIG